MKLSLEIRQFLLEDGHTHQHDILGLQRTATLHVEVKFIRFAEEVVVCLNEVRILILVLCVLRLQPILGLWEQCVSQSVVRIVFETDSSSWVPLSMLLGETLLSISPDLDNVSLSVVYTRWMCLPLAPAPS